MDGTIKFWDLNVDGNMYKTLRFADKNILVLDCKWSPNCTQIAAVGTNKSVSCIRLLYQCIVLGTISMQWPLGRVTTN